MHQNSSDLFFSWLSKPKINDLGRPHPAYSIITPLRMILLKVPLRTNVYHAVAMNDEEDGDLFDAIIKPKEGERGCRLIESSDKPLFFSQGNLFAMKHLLLGLTSFIMNTRSCKMSRGLILESYVMREID